MQEFGDGSVNFEWIASKLNVGVGGSPSRQAVRMLLSKVDDDEEWYPGKSYQTQHGPAPLLTKKKRSAEPWKETRQDFQARVARVAKEANSKCDLRLLCCEYLTRLEMLVQTKGDRLKK